MGQGVYPRVCGGTGDMDDLLGRFRGLSPRVRGNRTNRLRHGMEPGSIPACAGEPCPRTYDSSPCTVYPRVCGGTFRHQPHRNRLPGLSPRVRGNRTELETTPAAGGSIPACAGEPPGHRGGRIGIGVYPRVCGGTVCRQYYPIYRAGLSPRVRGNPPSWSSRRAVSGSIPACAGEPTGLPHCPYPCRIYPRVCGGTEQQQLAALDKVGLSPRVRGNRSLRSSTAASRGSIPACAGEPCGMAEGMPARYGSIPACAGEPRNGRLSGVYGGVYPRVCGGTPRSGEGSGRHTGLSPRVRGNPVGAVVRVGCEGSIPACAGEPRANGIPHRKRGVYPRVCGGTSDG